MKNLRKVFADTVLEIGKKDKKVVVVVGDISHGIFKPFREKFPKRYFNIGILEQAMISVCAGFNKVGLIPIIHTISSFLIERTFEQIKLDFGYQRMSGNFVSVGSTFDYAALGCTHHCYNDFMLFKTLENSEIFYPGSENEFKTQLKTSYANNKITLYRITAHPHNYQIKTHKNTIHKLHKLNNGSKLTIICTAPLLKSVNNILLKNSFLKKKIDLLYVNSIKPFDFKGLEKSLKKTKKILVIEDHLEMGGISEEVKKSCMKLKISNASFMTIKNKFIRSYGTYNDIIEKIYLDEKSIKRKILKIMKNG